MSNYPTRAEVLDQVEALIRQCEVTKTKYYPRFRVSARYEYRTYRIAEVADRLSIFDWWNDNLSYSQLKDMRSFLRTAGRLGYNGYVCFKVGASGCANGMWAHKEESTNGYSPDGECLFRSFTPDYIEWDAQLPNGKWIHDCDKRAGHSLKEVIEFIRKVEAK